MATGDPLTRGAAVLRDTPRPTRKVLDLPAAAVRRGQPDHESVVIPIPVGTEHIQCELDTSFWPPDAEVLLWIDIFEQGGNVLQRNHTSAKASDLATIGNRLAIGAAWDAGDSNRNARLRARVGVRVLNGPDINLIGSVKAEP